MPFQQTLSSFSVFLIPWDTFANKSSRARVFHIMKVESKSISYHAFSLSLSLSLWQGESGQSASTRCQSSNLRTDCLEILPDCLPSIALECSSSTTDVLPKKSPHLPGEQTWQVKMILEACGDKVLLHLQDQVSFSLLRSSPAQFKHTPVERYFFKSKSIPYHQSQRQRFLMACFSFTLALGYGAR